MNFEFSCMVFRVTLRLLLVATLLSFGACRHLSETLTQPANLPSIVFVTIDTLRADHLGCYGYFRETSPTLDRLAKQSVFFRHAAAPIATTLPAHVSLFTSRYPIQTGVVSNEQRMEHRTTTAERVRFLAEMLAEIGYSTAAFVSATPVGRHTGIDIGFEHFDQPESRAQREAGQTNQRVLAWLDAAPAEPFFLWVHYFDPHKPYAPPDPFRKFSADPALIEHLRRMKVPEPWDAKVPDVNNRYDGEILYVDSEIDRLIRRLEATGRFEEMVLVVVGDHGEGLGEHDRIGHGEIHNEQLFVPLMVKFPDSTSLNGRVVDDLVSLIDVLPTLVAAVKLPVPRSDRTRFTGVDVFERESEPRRYALAQRSPGQPAWGFEEKFALVGLDWKYVFRPDKPAELFDMRKDWTEVTNVEKTFPRIAESMRDKLLAEIARYTATDTGMLVNEEVSPEVIEQLRSLGYVQ